MHLRPGIWAIGLLVATAGAANAAIVIERDAWPIMAAPDEVSEMADPEPATMAVSLVFDATVLGPSRSGSVELTLAEERAASTWLADEDMADGLPTDLAQALARLKQIELTEFDGWYLLSR
ncbi:MAG: hypothetical protein RIM84_09500 [Alphaproteobacteria bacterium]